MYTLLLNTGVTLIVSLGLYLQIIVGKLLAAMFVVLQLQDVMSAAAVHTLKTVHEL